MQCEITTSRFHPERKKKKLQPIKKFKTKNVTLVAKDGSKIIGFVTSAFVDFVFYKYGYIEEVFVDKGYRGKGVGSKLMKGVIKELKKMKTGVAFVTTEKKNRKAVKFYKGLGFTHDKKGEWFFKILSSKKL